MTDYERIKREFDLSLLQKDRFMSLVYPVGSIYMSINDISPASLFGGVWERIENAFLLAASSSHPVGERGGEEKHTLTVQEMPSHNHTMGQVVAWRANQGGYEPSVGVGNYKTQNYATDTSGGNQPHNNMPPYLSVYMWKRVG